MGVDADEQLFRAAAGAVALRALPQRRQSNIARPFAIIAFADTAHVRRYTDYFQDEPPDPSLADAADPSTLAHAESIVRGSGSRLMAWAGQSTAEALKLMPVLCIMANQQRLFFFDVRTLIEGSTGLSRAQQDVHDRIMKSAANRGRIECILAWVMIVLIGAFLAAVSVNVIRT